MPGRILSFADDHVGIIEIDNVAKRNAIDFAMEDDLHEVLKSYESNPEIRCVVITGHGTEAFCSGHDIAEINLDEEGKGEEVFLFPRGMTKPVIAAVSGHCWGGGLILALACDIRIASQNAVFGSPGARLGMIPVGGQFARLPRLMPGTVAVQFMMSAKPMGADEAHRWGFVTDVVPTGEVLPEAVKLAKAIAANAPSVIAAIKRGVQIGEMEEVEAAEQFEAKTNLALLGSDEAREGIRAFTEKRASRF